MAYVIGNDNKVSARPVTIKLHGNDAIIINGLQDGEIVVSEGLVKVRNASLVTPVFKDAQNPQTQKGA